MRYFYVLLFDILWANYFKANSQVSVSKSISTLNVGAGSSCDDVALDTITIAKGNNDDFVNAGAKTYNINPPAGFQFTNADVTSITIFSSFAFNLKHHKGDEIKFNSSYTITNTDNDIRTITIPGMRVTCATVFNAFYF